MLMLMMRTPVLASLIAYEPDQRSITSRAARAPMYGRQTSACRRMTQSEVMSVRVVSRGKLFVGAVSLRRSVVRRKIASALIADRAVDREGEAVLHERVGLPDRFDCVAFRRQPDGVIDLGGQSGQGIDARTMSPVRTAIAASPAKWLTASIMLSNSTSGESHCHE